MCAWCVKVWGECVNVVCVLRAWCVHGVCECGVCIVCLVCLVWGECVHVVYVLCAWCAYCVSGV